MSSRWAMRCRWKNQFAHLPSTARGSTTPAGTHRGYRSRWQCRLHIKPSAVPRAIRWRANSPPRALLLATSVRGSHGTREDRSCRPRPATRDRLTASASSCPTVLNSVAPRLRASYLIDSLRRRVHIQSVTQLRSGGWVQLQKMTRPDK